LLTPQISNQIDAGRKREERRKAFGKTERDSVLRIDKPWS